MGAASNQPQRFRDTLKSTGDLPGLAEKAKRSFDGTSTTNAVRVRLFAISQEARRRGDFILGRRICDEAWALAPDDRDAGKPNEWQIMGRADSQEKLAKIAAGNEVVFIMGCARSGTTVTQRCFATLHDVAFFKKENSLAALLHKRPRGSTLLLKRRSLCHLYVDLIPDRVKIVWMARHPFATITSSHWRTPGDYYLSIERWLAEHAAYRWLKKNHPAARLAVIRYEDLMIEPDAVQARIATALGLNFDLPFSRFQERAETVRASKKWGPLRPARAITPETIAPHRARIAEFVKETQPPLAEFSSEFGYETDV